MNINGIGNSKDNKGNQKEYISVKIFLMFLLLFFCIINGIFANEHFNKPIIEYFEQQIGRTLMGFALVDEDGDDIPDVYIVVTHMDRDIFLRRVSNLLKPGNTVSYDASKKKYDRELGAYEIEMEHLLEVNGRSMKKYFPNNRVDFPFEFARQERMNQ